MDTQHKKRIAREKEARLCWAEIGEAILGRGKSEPSKGVTYQPGMSVDDILAAANARQK